jgi:hypothetical protein
MSSSWDTTQLWNAASHAHGSGPWDVASGGSEPCVAMPATEYCTSSEPWPMPEMLAEQMTSTATFAPIQPWTQGSPVTPWITTASPTYAQQWTSEATSAPTQPCVQDVSVASWTTTAIPPPTEQLWTLAATPAPVEPWMQYAPAGASWTAAADPMIVAEHWTSPAAPAPVEPWNEDMSASPWAAAANTTDPWLQDLAMGQAVHPILPQNQDVGLGQLTYSSPDPLAVSSI